MQTDLILKEFVMMMMIMIMMMMMMMMMMAEDKAQKELHGCNTLLGYLII